MVIILVFDESKLMMMMKIDEAMRNEMALQRANLDLWSLSTASIGKNG